MVCSLKNIHNNVVAMARLVAKGYEEIYYKNKLKDSLTCSKEALRITVALIAQKKWKLNVIDIKTAFLQGEEIDRKVFVMPPKEAETNVWLLKKMCVWFRRCFA